MTPSFVASGPAGIHQGKRIILHWGLCARTCFTKVVTASANSGVSVCTVDDAKKLYSGFDLCAPNTSVSRYTLIDSTR